MGARGPLPKVERRRRNREPETRTLTGQRVVAPTLPDAGRLGPETRGWYAGWCASPQAELFTATDWLRLHMLALLVDVYWRDPSVKVLAEIRANESLLGATVTDRARMRLECPAST